MKIKLILLILFLNMNCTHYFVKDTDEFKLTENEISNLKSKKIAWLGFDVMTKNYIPIKSVDISFNSFKSIIQDKKDLKIIDFVNSGDRNILTKDKDSFKRIQTGKRGSIIDKEIFKENNTKNFFKFKTEGIDFKYNENPDINQKNLKNFLTVYLNFYKHLALEKTNEILILDKEENLYLKGANADYWIIGTHELLDNNSMKLFDFFTAIFYTFSLGLIPAISDVEIKSNFYIFDSKLNQLKNYQINKKYKSATSLIFFWGKYDSDSRKLFDNPIDCILFEPTIQEFSKLLAEDLK